MNWVYTDGGRAAAGRRGDAGDCATRAIAIATGMDYGEVYDLVNSYGAKERPRKKGKRRSTARTGVRHETMRKIMADLGWYWVPKMGIGTGCRTHLRADELPSGRLIVSLSKHYAAVIDGVIHDNHDPSRDGTRCVYGIWRRREDKWPGLDLIE
jgi:hypothetical protein